MTALRSSHTFVCEGLAIEDDVFVGHGVVLINDPRPRATIHGWPQAEIGLDCLVYACRSQDERTLRDSVCSKGLQQVSCTGLAHLQRRPENIEYMTMFFEDSLGVNSGNERAPLSLQAAGVRARRYEMDSALRGVVPADHGA